MRDAGNDARDAGSEVADSGVRDGGAPRDGGPSRDGGPAEIDVNGVVIDSDGFPLQGITVFIAGAAPVTTNVGGEFTIAGVTPPYDVLLVRAAQSEGTLWVGLTRDDPTLASFFLLPRVNNAALSGNLVTGRGSDYIAYGSASYRVEVGMMSTSNITMETVDAASVSGTFVGANATDLAEVNAQLFFFEGGSYSLGRNETSDTTFDLAFPNITGARASIQATALGAMPGTGVIAVRTGLAIPSADIEVDMTSLSPPVHDRPVQGGTFTAGTTMSWTPTPGAVHLFVLRPTDFNSTSAGVRVITAGSSAAVPDLSPYGPMYGTAEAYTWTLQAIGNANVDELADGATLPDVSAGRRDAIVLVGGSRPLMTP
ncbi:MAG: hypothetical protein RIT81_03200 [Deltaproteobacteria bacterium]